MDNAKHPKQKPEDAANATFLSGISAVILYFAFLTVLLWYILFLVPHSYLPEFLSFLPTLDVAPKLPTQSAVTLDLLLIALFGGLHSFFARPPIKVWMNLPRHYERSFFMIQTECCLTLLLFNFRNFEGTTLWHTDNKFLSDALVVMQMFGAMELVTATFALDHFELFGLSQGLGINVNELVGLAPFRAYEAKVSKDGNKASPLLQKDQAPQSVKPVVVTRWHYTILAHPIMAGFLIMLWSTPSMTMPRFLFASGYTIYILFAVCHLEEPDLLAVFGEAYTHYRASVARFIPFVV